MKKIILFISILLLTQSALAEPPKASTVFKPTVKAVDPNTFKIGFDIKPGFYLYKKRICIEKTPDSNFSIGNVHYPKAIDKKNRLGKIEQVYKTQSNLTVSILGDSPGEGFLKLTYQGCSEDGFCYPPEIRLVKLSINPKGELTSVTIENKGTSTDERAPSSIQKALASDNLVIIVLSFLGFGILLSFTPCVLPMVPILSGIIVGHGKNITTRKAFLLSLTYVLSMSFTYAILGAIIALLGKNLQAAMQTPWFIGLFSILFVILALSMFGLYTLELPQSWQNKLSKYTRGHEGGHYLNTSIMGVLSTLIISPCVTAPLIGALGYIAQTGNVVFGSFALFSLSFGMGLPLLIIGASAGKLLPKAGAWMNTVKSLFGFVLLGMAIYLLERITAEAITMILWGSLLIFLGIFLGAFGRSQANGQRVSQGFGIIALIYGVMILVGGGFGNTNPLTPLQGIVHEKKATGFTPNVTVTNTRELKQALNKYEGEPVILDYYADWCTSCKINTKTTLSDPDVLKALKEIVIIKVDVTKNNTDTIELLKKYNVVAPPTFIFISSKGTILKQLTLVGEITVDEFLDNLHSTLMHN